MTMMIHIFYFCMRMHNIYRHEYICVTAAHIGGKYDIYIYRERVKERDTSSQVHIYIDLSISHLTYYTCKTFNIFF